MIYKNYKRNKNNKKSLKKVWIICLIIRIKTRNKILKILKIVLGNMKIINLNQIITVKAKIKHWKVLLSTKNKI
jgi:hypothetical protein